MCELVLAVDIGGTKTAVALVGSDLGIVDRASAPTPGSAGAAAILEGVVSLARTLLDRAAEPVRCAAVGVGTAGVVDVREGTIISSTDTLASWAGTRVAERLREALAPELGALPVHVQNDVDAHAVGELRLGAAAGASSALLVAVGTGIGASLVLDGRIVRGHHHVAGELGHLPIAGADHLRCPCGRAGHLEALGSGIGLHRHFLALGGDPAVTDARAVVARAASDPLAARAVAESAAAVGRGIAGAVTLLDPETVVLSGGVAGAGAAWWDPMEAALREQLVDVLQSVPVVPGMLGDRAPLVGAAASAWELREAGR